MKKWFLSPFKGERYHFLDFQEGWVPQNLEEKFNYRHSSLYSVIEQTFGVWKNKWRILRDMPNYDIRIQERIIVATIVLHNFIRAHEDNDIRQGLSRRDTCESSRRLLRWNDACDLFFKWTWDKSGSEQYHSIDMWDSSIVRLPLSLML